MRTQRDGTTSRGTLILGQSCLDGDGSARSEAQRVEDLEMALGGDERKYRAIGTDSMVYTETTQLKMCAFLCQQSIYWTVFSTGLVR